MPADRPLAFLPVITKARELEGRVLLAAHLADHGFATILGRASWVHYHARFATGGVYFSPLLVPAVAARLAAIRARGHPVIAWDEEGLVYPDPDWYFANRVSAASVRAADALIAWGPVPADDLRATLPADIAAPLPFGNARLDLLLPRYRALYEAAGAALRARFGRYVLVNTNFDMVNHAEGPGGLLRRMRASGRLATPRDEARFADWAVFRGAMFAAFRDGLPRLHDALPGYTLVLRPHPSEDAAPYRALAQALPRLLVEPPAGAVVPWIVGAEAVLHNSCTTAVEAYLLGVPALAYAPDALGTAMDSPLPNLLSRRAADWDAVVTLLQGLFDHGPEGWIEPAQAETARRYIGGLDGEDSSTALAALAATMPGRLGRLGRAGPVRLLRRFGGRIVERLGLRHRPDDHRRFASLPYEEVADLAARIAAIRGRRLAVRRFAPDTYLIEAA